MDLLSIKEVREVLANIYNIDSNTIGARFTSRSLCYVKIHSESFNIKGNKFDVLAKHNIKSSEGYKYAFNYEFKDELNLNSINEITDNLEIKLLDNHNIIFIYSSKEPLKLKNMFADIHTKLSNLID